MSANILKILFIGKWIFTDFLTSDFTDFTDVGYAFGFGRDGEGGRENTSRGESRTITNSVVLLK